MIDGVEDIREIKGEWGVRRVGGHYMLLGKESSIVWC